MRRFPTASILALLASGSVSGHCTGKRKTAEATSGDHAQGSEHNKREAGTFSTLKDEGILRRSAHMREQEVVQLKPERMKYIAFIEGLTSSDRKATEIVLDIAILDIGETETIAMLNVKIPTAGDRPLKQFLHSEMLKFLTDDARSQAIACGKIELRNGHVDSELKHALINMSTLDDCLSERPRPVFR